MRRATCGWLVVATGIVLSCSDKRAPLIATDSPTSPPRAHGGKSNVSDGNAAGASEAGAAGKAVHVASGGMAGMAGAAGDPDNSSSGGEGQTPAYGNYELVVADGPWNGWQDDLGIAVDADSNPYIQDEDQIYTVKNGAVEPYLSIDDLASFYGYIPGGHFQDIDYGPDGKLYILFGRSIFRSSVAHEVEQWLDLSDMKEWVSSQAQLGVINTSRALLVIDAGAFLVSDVSAEKQFPGDVLQWSQGCAVEDLAVTSRGTFVYQPGCTAFPAYRGHADGSQLATMYPAPKPEFGLAASEFHCWGKGAGGGFLTVASTPYQTVVNGVTLGRSELRLYHLDEDSNRPTGQLLERLTDARAMVEKDESLSFYYCGVVGAPDASVWVTTFQQLWRFVP